MKTKCLKTDWLAPLLGIAVVAGTLLAVKVYSDLARQSQDGVALTATLDRLYQDQQLSMALRIMHNGDAAAAAKRLDLLLCDHIIQLDAELPSADARTRRYVEEAFQRMALVRPKVMETEPADSAKDCSGDLIVAQRILSRALSASPHRTSEARRRG